MSSQDEGDLGRPDDAPLDVSGPPGRHLEILPILGSLEFVEAATVVPGPEGEIGAIHVAIKSDADPEKVIGQIVSAVEAETNIKIDRRIVNVAQRQKPEPDLNEPTSDVEKGKTVSESISASSEVNPKKLEGPQLRVGSTGTFSVQPAEIFRSEAAQDQIRRTAASVARSHKSQQEATLPSEEAGESTDG